ncbi:MAG: hypothetical protein M3Y24_02245 [Acidobacteriota bacterium]|nr:hypothetical protein [Acidobacteriota bacterium]
MTMRLRAIIQKHEFVSWLAVISVGADPLMIGNYRFLHNVRWGIDRSTKVEWTNRTPTFHITGGAKILSEGSGMGSSSPILERPDANSEGRFDPPLWPFA